MNRQPGIRQHGYSYGSEATQWGAGHCAEWLPDGATFPKWLVALGILAANAVVKKGIPIEMGGHRAAILYVVLMVAVIVGVDLLLFRGRFWERLMANIGMVLIFGAFYLRFLKRP